MSGYRWDRDPAATAIRHLLALMRIGEDLAVQGCAVVRVGATCWRLGEGEGKAERTLSEATRQLADLRSADPLRGHRSGDGLRVIEAAGA